MSAVLITTALVIALACVPSIAALTAMGLAGGDGEPRNAFFGILGAVVGDGSVYNAVTCFTAYFGGEPSWRWWLMLLPPVAGLVGTLTYGDEPGTPPFSTGWSGSACSWPWLSLRPCSWRATP
jgi:hypothetical protein